MGKFAGKLEEKQEKVKEEEAIDAWKEMAKDLVRLEGRAEGQVWWKQSSTSSGDVELGIVRHRDCLTGLAFRKS